MFSIILVLLAAVTLVNGATIGVSDATTKMYASTMPGLYRYDYIAWTVHGNHAAKICSSCFTVFFGSQSQI